MIERVSNALKIEDRFERLNAIQALREENETDALAALFALLEGEDATLASRASYGLSVFRDFSEEQIAILARHLVESKNDWIRLSCAIMLMSKQSSTVNNAYLKALDDTFEKVAQVACVEVGARGGTEGTAALYRALDREEWHLRLSACKALIEQKTADQRVVDALLSMKLEPEATEHDFEDEDTRSSSLSLSLLIAEESEAVEMWGNLDSIIAQAKKIANNLQCD